MPKFLKLLQQEARGTFGNKQAGPTAVKLAELVGNHHAGNLCPPPDYMETNAFNLLIAGWQTEMFDCVNTRLNRTTHEILCRGEVRPVPEKKKCFITECQTIHR